MAQGGPPGPPQGLGYWGYHSQTHQEPAPSSSGGQLPSAKITSLEYDNSKELLWQGYSSGRVVASLYSAVPSELLSNPPTPYRRYVSFAASNEAVTQVLPLKNHVITVGKSLARMHTAGGLGLGTIKLSDIEVQIPNEAPTEFTAACLVRPNMGLLTAETIQPTHFIAGKHGLHHSTHPLSMVTLSSHSLHRYLATRRYRACRH
jgi:hypothetical protein